MDRRKVGYSLIVILGLGGTSGAATPTKTEKALKATQAEVKKAEGKTTSSKKDTKQAAAEKMQHEKANPEHRQEKVKEDYAQRLWKKYGAAVDSVQLKVDQIRRFEVHNRRLELENRNLKKWIEEIRYDCRRLGSKRNTRKINLRLSKETGFRAGRVLASIDYRPPGHLLPQQLYALGVSYMKARELEKAAVIFTFLTGLEEDHSYKRPDAFLLAGVSWYRMDHFKLADYYFDKTLTFKKEPENLRYLAQARLWKAVVAHRLESPARSQKWLRTLLDHHPYSRESSWVNRESAIRRPATTKEPQS